jgi:hypothetical protein
MRARVGSDQSSSIVSNTGGLDGNSYELYVSTFLCSIHDIDSARNRFGADFFLALSWIDADACSLDLDEGGYLTLAGMKPDGTTIINMDLRPDIFLINDRQSKLVGEEYYIADKVKGRIVNNRRIRGEFGQSLDVHLFPFDSHLFVVRMYFHQCYTISGRVPGIDTGWWGRVKNNEWTIGAEVHDRCYNEESAASKLIFRIYEFGVVGNRKWSYFATNYGPVINGLLCLVATTHWIDVEQFDTRINLVLVGFLTYAGGWVLFVLHS